jgi:hypothetical protein
MKLGKTIIRAARLLGWPRGIGRRDWIGLALLGLSAAALTVLREALVEPEDWAAACAGPASPWPCLVRQAILWLQNWGVWGGAAIVLGVWAVLGGPFAAGVAGVAAGIGGIVNYNVTWGVLGGSLAFWAWLRQSPAPAAGPDGAAPADAGSWGWPGAARRRSRSATGG